MGISFINKPKGSIVGSGTYVFRHYGSEQSYQYLEYIQSTGYQYIDTGITGGTSASYEIEMMPISTGVVYTYQPFFAPNSGNTMFPKIFHNNGGTGTVTNNWLVQSQSTGRNVNIWLGTSYLDTKCNIIYNGATLYLNNMLMGNIANAGWGDNNQFVCIFGLPTKGSVMRLYSLKMTKDNVLVRDFVPVKRLSDNELGLYDKENNVFYTNDGTGSFIAGPVIQN